MMFSVFLRVKGFGRFERIPLTDLFDTQISPFTNFDTRVTSCRVMTRPISHHHAPPRLYLTSIQGARLASILTVFDWAFVPPTTL